MIKILVRSLILMAAIAVICTGLYFVVNSAWGQANLAGGGGRDHNFAGTALNRPAPAQGFDGGGDRGGDNAAFSLEGLPQLGKTAGILLAGAALIALFEGLVQPLKRKFQHSPAG